MAARFLLLFVLPSLVGSQYCTNLDKTATNNSPLCVCLRVNLPLDFTHLAMTKVSSCWPLGLKKYRKNP